MAIVVGFPIPEDQLGPLEPLIAAVRFLWQTRGGCTRFFTRNPALNYINYSGNYGALIL